MLPEKTVKKNHCFRKFSLVELIVVLVIISLLSAVSVSALKEESPASVLNKTVLSFESWCAQIRYLCAENGGDMIIFLSPEGKFFFAAKVPLPEEGITPPETGPLRFNTPEQMEISTVESAEFVSGESEYIEIFRFYPSGGGVCINRPVIKVENLAKNLDISFFKGTLVVSDGDGSQEVEK